MKVFILPSHEKLRPVAAPFVYPQYSKDYGVEQDFLRYLRDHPELTTPNPAQADWHYLPVYWTRWHLNHDYAKNGIEELQQAVDSAVIDDEKTFTVCQYDDGPIVDIGSTTLFLSSRKGETGRDIPLLATELPKPMFRPRRRFLASFVGRISTHPIREDVQQVFGPRDDCLIRDANAGTRYFVRTLLASLVALCPRGYGGSSFRLFESMQLGVVPCLIGDHDTRPFREALPWKSCSFYARNASEALDQITATSHKVLLAMGREAKRTYSEDLRFGRWCRLVFRELSLLRA